MNAIKFKTNKPLRVSLKKRREISSDRNQLILGPLPPKIAAADSRKLDTFPGFALCRRHRISQSLKPTAPRKMTQLAKFGHVCEGVLWAADKNGPLN